MRAGILGSHVCVDRVDEVGGVNQETKCSFKFTFSGVEVRSLGRKAAGEEGRPG